MEPTSPSRSRGRPYIYLVLALGMAAFCFVGFHFTYFGPLLTGNYPSVSPVVHIHGWSFFLWYLLLPVQTILVRTRKLAVHRRLGAASVVLAAVMLVTGLIVVTVQIHRSGTPDGSPFWQVSGLPVLSTLVIFAVGYGLAMRWRRVPAVHKRLMILAAAAGLGAAGFRVVGGFFGFGPTTVPAGILITNLFPLAALVHDRIRDGRVHPVYAWGLPATFALESAAMALPFTPLGPWVAAPLAGVGAVLELLY